MKNPFKLLSFALLVVTGGGSAAAQITGSVGAAPATVDLNLSAAFAYYGNATVGQVSTDALNLGSFSDITFSGVGRTGQGTGSEILTTYTNGTSSASDSSDFSILEGAAKSASLTSVLFAPTETFNIYLSNFSTASDFTASLNGNVEYSDTDVVLPSSSDGNGTGYNHTYGVLTLTVTGSIGDTLTFTDANNASTVSPTIDPNGGINAITADAIPEPAAWVLMVMGGAGVCLIRSAHARSRSVPA